MRDRVVEVVGHNKPTVRDFMEVTGRGALHDPWVGGPKELADIFEKWFTAPACDGFVIGPTHQPGTFEDFVKFVVPELQKRGLVRQDYSGPTLRDHLRIPVPAHGQWRNAS